MDNTFPNCEKLYRAVFPESYMQMFWRKDGTVSSAAFTDKQGLSVERGDFREDENVIEDTELYSEILFRYLKDNSEDDEDKVMVTNIIKEQLKSELER